MGLLIFLWDIALITISEIQNVSYSDVIVFASRNHLNKYASEVHRENPVLSIIYCALCVFVVSIDGYEKLTKEICTAATKINRL